MFYKVNLFSLKSEFNFTHFVHYKVKIKTELKLTIERYKNASFLSEFCATNFSNSAMRFVFKRLRPNFIKNARILTSVRFALL